MINNSLLNYKVNQREFNLPTDKQILVENKLNNTKKNEVVAWLLWIFLGRLGFHRFYMDKSYGLGIFLLTIFGIILTCTIFLAFIGIPLICAAWIWWLIDGFYISSWTKHDNVVKKNQVINEVTNTNIPLQTLVSFNQHPYTPNEPIKSDLNHKIQPKGKHFLNTHSNK